MYIIFFVLLAISLLVLLIYSLPHNKVPQMFRIKLEKQIDNLKHDLDVIITNNAQKQFEVCNIFKNVRAKIDAELRAQCTKLHHDGCVNFFSDLEYIDENTNMLYIMNLYQDSLTNFIWSIRDQLLANQAYLAELLITLKNLGVNPPTDINVLNRLIE